MCTLKSVHIAEWSSPVARRAHNPKVVWFKSRLRNHIVVADYVSFATTFLSKKSSLIHSVAPPLQTTNAALVCGLASFAGGGLKVTRERK